MGIFSDRDIKRINEIGPNEEDYDKVSETLLKRGLVVSPSKIVSIFSPISEEEVEVLIDGSVRIKENITISDDSQVEILELPKDQCILRIGDLKIKISKTVLAEIHNKATKALGYYAEDFYGFY